MPLTCIEKLEHVIENGLIAIDQDGAILSEYARRLSWRGGPGMGDAFFKHAFNYQHRRDRVLMVAVTPTDDDERGFEELPANTFNPSDRKFLAAALVGNASVLNATDSDWREHRHLIADLGVAVHELCPDHLKDVNA